MIVHAVLHARAADVPPSLPPLEPPPATAPAAVPEPFISEVRGGLLYHEDSRLRRLLFNQSKLREDGIFDVHGEVLFRRLPLQFDNAILQFIFTPRVHVSTSINIGNGTSQASVGLAWDYYLTKRIFFEFTFGLAFHNGYTGTGIPPDNLRSLGCNPLSRQSFWLGFDITERWRILAGIEHLDNFDLCHSNQGLSNLGVRVGYRF
jgi:hypothetical protein